MNLHLDHVAIVGYSLLFAFGAYKIGDTMKRPLDLTATLLLLVGLGALITYHVRKLQTKRDETNDVTQKKIRLVAHSTLVAFLLITLTSMSKSNFQYYDWFALAGHTVLFITVFMGMPQLAGLALLAVYFLLFSIKKFSARGLELTQLIAGALLLYFFAVNTFLGVKPML